MRKFQLGTFVRVLTWVLFVVALLGVIQEARAATLARQPNVVFAHFGFGDRA